MSPEILLLGIGNILLRDEGIGVHTVNKIKERYTFEPEIDIIDGGTKGLDLLPLFEGRKKVLIVDAVDWGNKPGSISILRNGEIPARLHSKLSVHHIGLGEVLLAAQMLNIMPEEICLVGIQPGSIDTGIDMTPEVNSKMEDLISTVIDILRDWGVKCLKRSGDKDVSCGTIKDNK